MHRQSIQETEKETMNTNFTRTWLRSVNLKVEPDALITACQEQKIATKDMNDTR